MAASYAPVVVQVYNRLEHLQQCIDSLRANPLSRYSDLYVVSDAAFVSSDASKVGAVREYIDQVEGFRNVLAIKREKNLGSFLSAKRALDYVLATYGVAIFLEDDNVVSPNFLGFVNDGLSFYQDDLSIFSISGYNFLIGIPMSYPYDVYKWQGFTAWGVGLWSDRWNAVDWGCTGFDGIKKDRAKQKAMDRIDERLYGQVLYNLERDRKIIDVIVSYYVYMKGLYSIFPVVSKVRNTGTDGTGEHAGVAGRFTRQPIDHGADYKLVRGITPDEGIYRELRRYNRIPAKRKAIAALARIIPRHQKDWIKKHLTNGFWRR